LFGNFETWGDADKFLRHALGSDYSVVKYSYRSKKWGRNPSIEEIATQLKDWIDTTYPVTKYPDLKLFLAGHSMGGLVAKEYILSMCKRGYAENLRVKGIVLAAVPNRGAQVAKISRLPGGKQIEELKPFSWSAIKQYLGFSYTTTFVEKQQKEWMGRVNTSLRYYASSNKTNMDVLVFYAMQDEVVDRESATAAHPTAIPLDGNHTTIVKPTAQDDQIILSMAAFIRGVPEEEPIVEPAKSLPTQRIHYIDPSTAFNTHYARFELHLRHMAYATGIDIQHHVPAGDNPEHNLDLLGRLLTGTPSNEPIGLVPRQFGSTKAIEDQARTLIHEHQKRHIILIDQEPPYSIGELPNVTYVGPDNWLVGSLAALALAAHLSSLDSGNFQVLAIEGPGGQRRCDGFVDTVSLKSLRLTNMEPVRIGDLDRFDTASLVHDLIRDSKYETVAGFFAGNDETAASFIDAIEDYGHSGVVIGCDGTREIRQLVSRSGTAIVDTVLTHPDEQAKEVIRVASEHDFGMHRYRQPTLERYRYNARQIIAQCGELQDWWPDSPTAWHDQMCGPTST
jgi:alpha-beta hydrolase superfamily lysophospholipase